MLLVHTAVTGSMDDQIYEMNDHIYEMRDKTPTRFEGVLLFAWAYIPGLVQ